MQKLLFGLMVILLFSNCQKEKISTENNISDLFYVENLGVSMRVLVEGNIASKTILLFVHGGPGSSSYFYNTDYISENIEDKYAVAYWDQRMAGASQGNINANDLTLENMTDDMKKVIQTLKARYGQEVGVFILGHSFGGMVTTSFMTTKDNQKMVKGWIFFSAAHNYPLNDSLSKVDMMIAANEQISLGRKVAEWQEILNYCNALPAGKFTLEQSNQLNTYAHASESYFEEFKPFPLVNYIINNNVEQNYALSSAVINIYRSVKSDLNDALTKVNFTSNLSDITTPILSIFGKYDFICPAGLGEDLLNRVSSTYKNHVILPNSSHAGMFQDEKLFCDEINNFIQLHR
jgi:pimeloyl-ACP methyl ester carboxylesterase